MVDAKDLDYGAYACEAMTWSPRGVHSPPPETIEVV